jgi:hypothetical protein
MIVSDGNLYSPYARSNPIGPLQPINPSNQLHSYE